MKFSNLHNTLFKYNIKKSNLAVKNVYFLVSLSSYDIDFGYSVCFPCYLFSSLVDTFSGISGNPVQKYI